MHVQPILVDRRNFEQLGPQIKEAISKSEFVGFDYETNDDRRHEGLNQRCGYDPITRKKGGGKTKPLIFDFRRTDVCGASFYSEAMEAAYYLNVGHADVENRLTHDELISVMRAKPANGYFVAHNAPFELAVSKACLGLDLSGEMIDTLQMCVSAYGPHEYRHEDWLSIGQGGIGKLIPALVRESITGLVNRDKMEMSPELSELAYKIISKESDSEWSYNGMVKEIAYGYGLKKAVASHFNFKMTTFEECLGDKAHMGQLTGEETAAYGADDAYWAMRLFRHLLTYMVETGGAALVKTFFEQENPLAGVFADLKLGGLRVNIDAIDEQLHVERVEAAKVLRRMRAEVRKLLPFPVEPNERLMKYEKWYQNGFQKYRANIAKWAETPDCADDYVELTHARGPVSNEWMAEKGFPKGSLGPNFSHYMPQRTLLYDLIGTKAIVSQGAVQGDGEARGKLITRLTKEGNQTGVEIINCINALSSIEQRMKLYVKPYRQLTDPETSTMYPTVSSMLATRRMAGQDPNGMQLAKRGESVFVRGYFEPDQDDHVTVSIDWSAVELVEIGEFSEDREFIKAFGQLPHDDLHSGSAAPILAVEVPGYNVELMKKLRAHTSWGDYADDIGMKLEDIKRLTLNLKGEQLIPNKAYGYWRTEIGKGANFNYWYSGWLATIGERMGWGPERTAEATDAYRSRFPEAEEWRVNLIAEVQRNGYVTLPDGHRYVRYECTPTWAAEWCNRFISRSDIRELDNYHDVIRWLGRKIAKRGGNQTVNAYIQGTCATIAKRSILKIVRGIKAKGFPARFAQPIHDELVFSCQRDAVPDFVEYARGEMIDHPDLFKLCKLDASPSIGLTFEPWNAKSARIGQVELFEPPAEIVGKARENTRLDKAGVKDVVDFLFEERARQRRSTHAVAA